MSNQGLHWEQGDAAGHCRAQPTQHTSGIASACADHGHNSALPEQKAEAACENFLFSQMFAPFFEVTVPMHLTVKGPPDPLTPFSLASFSIRKAASFRKVCLGLHCTHLFAMNEKHFSFSLYYYCQILCVHVTDRLTEGAGKSTELMCMASATEMGSSQPDPC